MKTEMISKWMTPVPHSVGSDQPLGVAERLMREHQVRHLPVLRGGVLVGVLSDRDLKVAKSLKDVDFESTPVNEVAIEDVYQVSPDAKLSEVVTSLCENKIGSALVVDHQKLVGIFTTTDALRILGRQLVGG